MKKYLTVTFLFLLTTSLFGQEQSLTKDLQRINEGNAFPGFAVAIVTADSIIYAQAFGYADASAKKPFTVKTIINIGSVSKTFVGVALLKAIEEGYLNLNTDINKLLPFKVENPHFPGDTIKVRHLVTHTSGIIDREEVYKKAYTKNLDQDDLEGFLKGYLVKNGKNYSSKNFLKYKPGTRQEYSNISSALAAYVIESATKKPFHEYSREIILAPLQMEGSGWFFKNIEGNLHATLYDAKQKPVERYSLLTYPDGGLKSNLRDLSIYLQEMMKGYAGKGELLSDSSYSLLFQPQFRGDFSPENINPKEPNIGVFWVHRKNGEIGHTGSDPGITTFLFFNPKTGTGRIFMTNTVLEQDKQVERFAEIWKLLGDYKKQEINN